VKILVAVLIAAACVPQQPADPAKATAVTERGCKTDQDCPSGFCDRGVCQAPSGIYGRPCQAAPRGPDGLRDSMLSVCSAYLCVDGRCRSCSSDAECRSELGSPKCYKLEGEPGMRCGDPPNPN
jgi:hypothetical protein